MALYSRRMNIPLSGTYVIENKSTNTGKNLHLLGTMLNINYTTNIKIKLQLLLYRTTAICHITAMHQNTILTELMKSSV